MSIYIFTTIFAHSKAAIVPIIASRALPPKTAVLGAAPVLWLKVAEALALELALDLLEVPIVELAACATGVDVL